MIDQDTRVFEATFILRDGRQISHTGAMAEIEALWQIHRLRLKGLKVKQIDSGKEAGKHAS